MGPYAASHDLPIRMTPDSSAPMSAAAARAALQARLPLVRKPAQYLGLEHNAVSGEFRPHDLNFCLLFPDIYEIGMSHQGLQILYHILNSQPGVTAHRSYVPDTDMEALLREQKLPLCSLEAGMPLARYDVLGITLPYELCFTNILTVLDLAGLPLRARDRDEGYPLVLGGGSCAFNPEPVADFFDAILVGDAEEAVVRIAEVLRTAKAEKTDRAGVLARLATVTGVYVPAFFAPRYENGRFAGMKPLRPGYTRVRRAILPELDDGGNQCRPLVPVVGTVHDRLAMEIARGCTRGCRFCQAGIIYRPVRERSVAQILDWADRGIAASGFEEMALLSLSTGDYSCLDELVLALMNRFARKRVSLSMPSMRVGTITPAIMEQIRRVRKTGFTVAPEAGSERLRRVINKGITEADLLATCKNAFSLGWKLVKCYFMTGLPTETEADVEAIVELVRAARNQAGAAWKNVQINLGVGTFVPKACTAFQWEGQLGLEAAQERIHLLKRLLPARGYHLKWHDPRQSYLEGVFARGDRRLSLLVEAVWQRGARLDSWGEQFNLALWQEAAADCGLNPDDYLRPRGLDEALPWEHLDCGVSRDFLLRERERAFSGIYTPDCRTHGCQGCGICDFRTIKPTLHREAPEQSAPSLPAEAPAEGGQPPPRCCYRVLYSRRPPSHLLGHLELLVLVFRALRRAGLPIAYTQGFNPSPRVSFSQALPVGMESLAEYFDMELTRPVMADAALVEALNRELPPGLVVSRVTPAPKKQAAAVRNLYEIDLPEHADAAALAAKVEAFRAAERFPLTRFRKGKSTTFDIRPLVASLEVGAGKIRLALIQEQGRPGVSPREVLEQVCALAHEEALCARIVRLESGDVGSGLSN